MSNAYRPFVVAKIVSESETAKSIFLAPADGAPLSPYRPGQHLPLRLALPGSHQPVVRSYTLSDRYDPSSRAYRLTVKREAAGHFSRHLHDALQVGHSIEAKPPNGQFFLDTQTDHPVVLIGGGIGVTPMIAMANAVAAEQPGRAVIFLHGVRNSAEHSFAADLRKLAATLPRFTLETFYSQPLSTDVAGEHFHRAGRIDVARLAAMPHAPDAEYFICGPKLMMADLVAGLVELGIDPARIRTETFASPAVLAPQAQAPPVAVEGAGSSTAVTFARSGKAIEWEDRYETLLALAEANDIAISSGCQYGDCGTCLTRVLSGTVIYNHPTGIEPEPQTCLPCSCRPAAGLVLDA